MAPQHSNVEPLELQTCPLEVGDDESSRTQGLVYGEALLHCVPASALLSGQTSVPRYGVRGLGIWASPV